MRWIVLNHIFVPSELRQIIKSLKLYNPMTNLTVTTVQPTSIRVASSETTFQR